MAITAQTISPLPSGAPSVTPAGQIVWGPGDVQEPAIVGTATFTGDGATTAAVVNWIDGTQTLPFTPKMVLVFQIYPTLGSGTNDTSGVLQVEGSNAAPRVTSLSNTSFTVNYSTAIASAKQASILILVYR